MTNGTSWEKNLRTKHDHQIIKNKIEPEYHRRKLNSYTCNKNRRKQQMSQEAITRQQRRKLITSIHHKSLRRRHTREIQFHEFKYGITTNNKRKNNTVEQGCIK